MLPPQPGGGSGSMPSAGSGGGRPAWGQGEPGGGSGDAGGGFAAREVLAGEGDNKSLPPLLQGAAASPGPRAAKGPPPKVVWLSREFSNRDYFLVIECKADTLILQPWGTRFAIGGTTAPGQEHPLVQTIRRLVARRQATVRPGEPAYRPMIRFDVHPNALRAYYFAYPLLDPLGYPMSRVNLEK